VGLRESVKEIRDDIKKYSPYPEKVKIVAATKYTDENGVRDVVAEDIVDVGENRVQAMMEKLEKLSKEELKKIRWNFIGHLQKNKVKYIIESVSLIHSVDSLPLADEINKRAKITERVVDILLEVNISNEESKSGYSVEELYKEAEEYKKYSNLNIIGLMTMAPLTEDEKIVRGVFKKLRELKDELNENIFYGKLTELSMGMTNDYKIALEEGATMIRIGSKIFK
jgi:pyridoxal phosphate enzyme (YggS family)